MNTARRYLVSGLVQGVGYRYFALRRAQDRGAVGYVQNLPDGRVEIIAEAPEEALDALKMDLEVGPRFSKVAKVEDLSVDPSGQYTSFTIAH